MAPSVLIVDDERDAIDAMKMFLDLQGLDIRLAYSGAEGLAAIRQAVPDLVLLDLQMPGGMDGWETLKQMRQIAPDIRVVILTGSVPDRDLEQLVLKEGARGIITKPIQINELAPKIRAFIKGETP